MLGESEGRLEFTSGSFMSVAHSRQEFLSYLFSQCWLAIQGIALQHMLKQTGVMLCSMLQYRCTQVMSIDVVIVRADLKCDSCEHQAPISEAASIGDIQKRRRCYQSRQTVCQH